MKERTDRNQDQITRLEGLRRVLLGQYMFHEAKWSPAAEGDVMEAGPTIPKAVTLADIYKCLHQGEFGVGHSIDDVGTFSRRLGAELLAAEPSSVEPVLEDVSPAGAIFRINLRPYRTLFHGRDASATEMLANACLSSAKVRLGSLKSFINSLKDFRDLNAAGELVVQDRSYIFPEVLVDSFLAQVDDFIKGAGTIPVLSHSAIYKRYNAPSYRVVDRATLVRSDLAFLLSEAQ
jgi:hypothetical protein